MSVESLSATANQNVRDILTIAVGYTSNKSAVVVADGQSELARMLALSYRANLPTAAFVNFDEVSPAEVLQAFEHLTAGDLVVLVQSTSFRLEAFRIRVELFKRGLHVIEHPHLGRMGETEYGTYLDALAYDPAYYRVVGPALKERIDRAVSAVVDSGDDARLVYESAFEPAKLNIGEYSTMKNVGGQFPIGEVFTEPKDLERVNGRVRIFAFGDSAFRVNVPPRPITLLIETGKVVDVVDSTPEFDRVLANIRADEEPWIRELGFGMNRALTRERVVDDVGSYERMCGIHLSLGAKHGVYNKPNVKRKDARFHVDVFAVTEQVRLDDDVVYESGAWRVTTPL